MSYQVLARRWRPQTFEQMVGQEHVLRALVNAFGRNRLHHAYLLTGTRGVGKTTLARLIAKCLNCETGITATPCGTCSACTAIAEGRFVDLIEVDAASRTKVEDTRELLENVQYAPTLGRYKVYLIDEVHMLSGHSFNALLKTLEEPPPHITFLLATTDPQKLPTTVLSRCLQFHLRNLSPEQIATHLAKVLRADGIEFEEPALWDLGRAADGSMRDALSLTDQAIAYGGGSVSSRNVTEMLGYANRELMHQLVAALIANDASTVLQAVAGVTDQGIDCERALIDMLALLHRVSLAQYAPGAVDRQFGDHEQILAWAAVANPADIQLFYQIGLLCRRDLPLAPDPRSGLEMALLRMLAFRPVNAQPVDARVMLQHGATAAEAAHSTKKPETVAAPAEAAIMEPIVNCEATEPVPANPGETIATSLRAVNPVNWALLLDGLKLSGAARAVAANCIPERVDGERIHLLLDDDKGLLHTLQCNERIQAALSEFFGSRCEVVISRGQPNSETPARQEQRCLQEAKDRAEQAIRNDPNVQLLLRQFSGRLHAESIHPRSDDVTSGIQEKQ